MEKRRKVARWTQAPNKIEISFYVTNHNINRICKIRMISFSDLFAVMHELKMSKFTSRFGQNTEKLVETKHRFLLNETFKKTNTDKKDDTDVFFAGVTKILTQYLIFNKNKMPQRRSCNILSLDVAIASAMPVFSNAMWEERWNAPTHVRTYTHTHTHTERQSKYKMYIFFVTKKQHLWSLC